MQFLYLPCRFSVASASLYSAASGCMRICSSNDFVAAPVADILTSQDLGQSLKTGGVNDKNAISF